MKKDTIFMLCTKQRFMFGRLNSNSPIVPQFYSHTSNYINLLHCWRTIRAVVKNHPEE